MVHEETKTMPAAEQAQTPPVAPDITEQMKALQAERDRFESELKAAQRGLGTAAQTIRQRDDAIRNQNAIKADIDSVKEQLKILAGYVAQSKTGDSNDYNAQAGAHGPDLMKQFEEAETKKKADLKTQEDIATVGAFEARVNALGITPNDEAYYELKKLVIHMDPDELKQADIKLRKMEEAKMPKADEKKPVAVQNKTVDELVAEQLRAEMIKRGMLTPESANPSASAGSDTDFLKQFGSGDVPMTKVNVDRYNKIKNSY